MGLHYFTFGLQYRHEPHPVWSGAHPDGWVTVDAPTAELARKLIVGWLGHTWAFQYGAADAPGADHFPLGELARITFAVRATVDAS